jgi:hypothetical protein
MSGTSGILPEPCGKDVEECDDKADEGEEVAEKLGLMTLEVSVAVDEKDGNGRKLTALVGVSDGVSDPVTVTD